MLLKVSANNIDTLLIQLDFNSILEFKIILYREWDGNEIKVVKTKN